MARNWKLHPRKPSPRCLMCGKWFMSSAQLEHHITEAVRLCKPTVEGE